MPRSVGIQSERARVSVFSVVILFKFIIVMVNYCVCGGSLSCSVLSKRSDRYAKNKMFLHV